MSEPTTRRDFLRLAGYSFALAGAGCSRGLEYKAIPLLNQPEELTPGRASWYATRCGGCAAGCGVLAKSRDGRPIKLEGNPDHPLAAGGLCAAGQAQVLSLYDALRLKQPLLGGKPATWDEVDAFVRPRLAGTVRLLTGTVNGPAARYEIARFLGRFDDARHVMYDTPSCAALLDAQAEMFGRRVLPRYRFDRADVIVSFEADFLGTWISPVEFTRGYVARRRPDGEFSRHVQLESRMSLTGSNADERIALAPDEIGPALAALAARKGPAAKALWDAPGRSLVVCGTNDIRHQRLAARINAELGNYGETIDVTRPSQQRLGDDRALLALRDELAAGQVDVLLVAGCNPVYDLPGGLPLDKAGLVVSFAEREDETAAGAQCVCPEPHPLETWSDAEPVAGTVTVGQPLLAPLGSMRPLVESLAAWRGDDRDAYALMREAWRQTVFPRQRGASSFELFWARSVHDGFARLEPGGTAPRARSVPEDDFPAPGDGLYAVVYETVGLRDGRHAHNAWLQELPDPVTKVVWDNYASLSPATAERLGVATGDVVAVAGLELPALVQPGQHDRVVAIALGYGRKGTDRFHAVGPDWIEAEATVAEGETVGVNAAPLLAFHDGRLACTRPGVTVEPTGRRHALACTQLHHTLTEPAHIQGAKREIAQETTLAAFRKDPAAGRFAHHETPALWPDDHPYEGHRWGMAIDLTACTGCSACMLGCQAENNVPVVGRDEVGRQRDMHWIRLDRYYDEHGTAIHQPMTCQHCANAPCESVCPVLATVHSSEGLNQQVYNRCVGTRYCANNCPYKVRRFNWFDYPREDRLQNLVLNPDLAVRMRGVMEKCSLCVQRIQEGKAEAKREGRPLRDGEIATACEQSCPADAIVFGDLNDPESRVAKARASGRHFRVLEELDTQPALGYLTLVRNRDV